MEKKAEEDYISLLAIAKRLLGKRKKLLRIVLVFFLFGVFIAIFSPDEFTSKVKFLSQSTSVSRTSGKWSGIAALVGVNLNTGVDNEEIPSNIYPKVISSLSFQRKLMETKLNFKKIDSGITFSDYFSVHDEKDVVSVVKKYTIGLPKTIIESFKGKKKKKIDVISYRDSLIFIDSNEQKLRKELNESILFSIDEADGVLTISSTLSEAIPAAQLTKSAYHLLQEEIIAYRTAKAKDQMLFIDKQYKEQKYNFEIAQRKFAQYKDRNKYNITQTSQIEYQKLQTNYDLSYTVFSELQRQRVAQQIQVNKDTPVFTTINEAIVPIEISNSNGFRNIMVFTILGFIIAIIYGLGIEFIQNFKKVWKEIK